MEKIKVGDLIKVLQTLNPEREVTVSLGESDNYREKCAKAELVTGDCLGYLSVVGININPDDEKGLWADIILEHSNVINIEKEAMEFPEMYEKRNDG